MRVHNLRDVDADIPRNALTVVSGVSGSGKSSLAFDTLYAEGRRRYVECLSTYLQQFVERLPRPEAREIGSLPPAVALERAVPAVQARSTVGTTTEIHDHLRLLYSRIGWIACVACGRGVAPEPPGRVAQSALSRSGPALVTFDAEPPRRASGWGAFVERWTRAGFARAWHGGEVRRIEALTDTSEPVEIVADRVLLEPRRRARLVEAVELAYRFGHDRCRVRFSDGSAHRYSARLHCPECDREAPPLRPNLFSPNSPLGACPVCQGFGRSIRPDPHRVIPDRGLSLAERPVSPWNKPSYAECYEDLRRAGREVGLDWHRPYAELPAAHRSLVEEGGHGFYGIRGFFEWLERRTYKVHVRVFLARYRQYLPCKACGGARLRPEALAVTVGGRNIAEMASTPVGDLLAALRNLRPGRAESEIAAPILAELDRRLRFLVEVGLGYLTLDRPSRTLSGGEAQRIQLARSLGSGLVDTLYVLDEPSVGLHPRDVDRLLAVLERLRDLGNTVVVVEHDPRVIERADWLIDLGPGAGERGGRVLYQGPPSGIASVPDSATGAWLAGRAGVTAARPALSPSTDWIEIEGASAHNLRDVTVRFPRRALTVVTGVSGSGKSSLVHDTLHGALALAAGGPARETGPYRALRGAEGIAGVELVDQSPIGRSPRSNPVTYVKAFDGIRRRLAATPAAKARGLKPGYFSFNVPGGRCDRCEGSGAVVVEMHFLADLLLPCDECGGSRFGPGALDVRYRDRNVAEILEMTVNEALAFFEDAPDVANRLRVLDEIGLGYLRLGQPAPTLSGGEAQRLKLADHLARRRSARSAGSVFLLDEPTTGLHLRDVEVLVGVLRRLVVAGHTIVVVEHHLSVLRAADWIVELGPGAGDEGGAVVATGPPAEIERSRTATGTYLSGGGGRPTARRRRK